MSNDEFILKAVGKKCPNRFCPKSSPVHIHQPLIGGRARATESYPERLCIAILRALRQSMRSVGLLGAMEDGYHVDEPEVSVEVEKYYDDITGALLEPDLVRKARAEEVEFLERLPFSAAIFSSQLPFSANKRVAKTNFSCQLLGQILQ